MALNRSRGSATTMLTLRPYRSRRTSTRIPPCFSSCSSPTTSRRSSARGGLEELVLREGLEELDDLLVVVRARDQVLGGEDLLQLVVQERRLGGRLHVRLRCEQADQARLADDLALGAHPAYTDVVHPRAAMHGGVRVRLAEHQQVAVLDASPHRGIEGIQQRDLGERRPLDVRTGCPGRSPPPPGSPGPAPCPTARTRGSRAGRSSAAGASRGSRRPRPPLAASSARRRRAPGRSCAARAPASARSRAPRAGRRAGSSSRGPRGRPASSSESVRSSSKCITDSRWLASRPDITRSMRPCSSRTVPTTGWSTRRTVSSRAASSSVTESTRNGESSVVGLDDGAVRVVPVALGVGIEDADDGGTQAASVDERERGGHQPVELLGLGRGELLFGQTPDVGLRERVDRVASLGWHPLVDEREQSVDHRMRCDRGEGDGGGWRRSRSGGRGDLGRVHEATFSQVGIAKRSAGRPRAPGPSGRDGASPGRDQPRCVVGPRRPNLGE